AEVILSATLPEAGLADVDPARSLLIDHALRREAGIVRFALSLDRPLVGLGASAAVYYPAIGDMLSVACEVPTDADVANAVGAVVGRVRATVTVFVTAPEDGIFMLSGAGDGRRFTDEEKAFDAARERASEGALEHARQNGAVDAVLALVEEIDAPEIDGSRKLVEARFIATASGRPRLAHGQ
ncbi:MAG: hydantoinase/oxoprolinase family protein, partial [Rhizobium sp.]|nr:hydantoinase/oxoprolinase family protein [Rhizobium sp.]